MGFSRGSGCAIVRAKCALRKGATHAERNRQSSDFTATIHFGRDICAFCRADSRISWFQHEPGGEASLILSGLTSSEISNSASGLNICSASPVSSSWQNGEYQAAQAAHGYRGNGRMRATAIRI